jgi:malonate transporter
LPKFPHFQENGKLPDAKRLKVREAIMLSALPVGFFGVPFELRFNVWSEVAGTTLIASTVLSAATLTAAIYLTAGIGLP